MSDDRPERPDAKAGEASSADAIRRRRQAEAEQAAAAEAEAAPRPASTDPADDATDDGAAPARRRVFDPAAASAQDKLAAGAGGGGRRGRGGKARKPARQANVGDAAEGEVEDFAAMFEATVHGKKRGGGDSVDHAANLEPGQQVSGTIIEIGSDNVFVDLGGKTEAFIPRDELLDADGQLTVDEGDAVTARVVGVDRGGQIRLATRGGGGSVALEDAFVAGVPVHGRVASVNKGGFEIEVMGQRGFCPISQIDLTYTEDPQVHVGQSYDFKVIEYAENGRRIVLSRAELLRETARERAEKVREKLEVGAILEGEVRSIQDYGAFIDLGGIDGLVHVSEISHGRVEKPAEVLTAGQTVTVKVLSIEQGKKGERIALSIKAAQADPWEQLPDWLTEGARTTGTVTRLAPFGAFVELAPAIEGLVHVSEMSWEKHVRHPKEVVREGDQVEVQVLNIERENRRIGLSLKAALGDPWVGAAERFPLGSEVSGVVERLAEFGVFVKVEAGVVALIPMSELGTRPGVPAARDFSVGQEVTARVLAVDEERHRLTLSRKEEGEVVGLGRGVQRRRTGAGGDEAGAGGGGRPRGGGGRRRDEDRGAGNATSYREAGGTFATLGDLLRSKSGRKEE